MEESKINHSLEKQIIPIRLFHSFNDSNNILNSGDHLTSLDIIEKQNINIRAKQLNDVRYRYYGTP